MPETPEFHIANKSTKFQRLQSFENFSRIVASIRTFFANPFIHNLFLWDLRKIEMPDKTEKLT